MFGFVFKTLGFNKFFCTVFKKFKFTLTTMITVFS